MPNAKNIDLVKNLREKVAKSKSILFADLQGLKANDANNFRAKMLETKAEVSMAKNSLLEIALKAEKKDTAEISKDLIGQTVAIFTYEDAVAPIKAFFDFAKKFELAKVKSALLDGKYTTSKDIETLSKLPSRDQLLAQVLYTLKSPLTGFVTVLGGSQKKFVYALAAIAKKKEVQQ